VRGELAPSQTGTLSDPLISEVGRKFLADLLTETQRRSAARSVQCRALRRHPARGADGYRRSGRVVAAFKHKRDESGGQVLLSPCKHNGTMVSRPPPPIPQSVT